MRVWIVLAGVVLVVAVVLVLVNRPSPADQIHAKVQQLADSIGKHDYPAICRDVLAPSLVAHLTVHGIPCAIALQAALGGVSNPVVSIGKIVVHGRRASAYTLTVASGQQASLDTVQLIETKHGWRISSLAHL